MSKSPAALLATTIIAALATPGAAAPGSTIVTPRDLAIDSINITLKPGTTISPLSGIATVQVTIRDYCKSPGIVQPYVSLIVSTAKDGDLVGSDGASPYMINGKSVTVTFDVAHFNLLATAYLDVGVNLNHIVSEVNTTNNYMTRNPATAPFPPPISECKATVVIPPQKFPH